MDINLSRKEPIERSIRVIWHFIVATSDNALLRLMKLDLRSKLLKIPENSYLHSLKNLIEMRGSHNLQKKTHGVLIMTVRDDELQEIRAAFGIEDDEFDFDNTCYKKVLENSLFNTAIIVAQIEGTGQNVSGHDTADYIHIFKEIANVDIEYAILVGICAGSKKRRHANLFDIVVPDEIFDTSVYKLSREGNILKRTEEVRCPGKPDNFLIRCARGVANHTSWFKDLDIVKKEFDSNSPVVHIDPLFTDNFFSEDEEYMNKCSDLYNRKTIAYEMEAGGFAMACHRKRIPFIVIRSISDWADKNASSDESRSAAAKAASAFALEFVKRVDLRNM